MPVSRNTSEIRKNELLQAFIILFLLLAAFFWRSIVHNEVLLPANLVFETDPLWYALAPADYQDSLNRNLGDQVAQFYPWEVFTRRSLSQGELPFWNPYTNGGQPFIGNAQSGLLNPFNLIGYLFAIDTSFVVEAFLRLFVAGFSTFLFARQIGVKQYGALLAMIIFAFAGPMIVWVGYPLASVIVWLPILLLAVDKFLVTNNRIYLLLGSLFVAAQFLGGHPETSFIVMLFVGVYALFRTWMIFGHQISVILAPLSQLILMFLLGFLLSAIQLLPFLETLWYSDTLAARQNEVVAGGSLLQRVFLDWHEWPTAITMFLPDFLGTPLNNSIWYPYSNYVEFNTYAGILPLVLAIFMAIFAIKNKDYANRKMVLFFAAMGMLSLGLAFRLPLINLINELPLFNISASGRFRLLYVFCIALLAGFGLDNFIENGRFPKKQMVWLLLLVGLGSTLLVGAAYFGFSFFADRLIENGRIFMETQHGTLNFTRPLDYYYNLVLERQQDKLKLYHPSNVVMYLPLLISLIVFLQYRRSKSDSSPHWRGWVYLIVGLTIVDLFLVGRAFNSTTIPENMFPTPEAVQILQDDPQIFRISATDSILNPNSSILYELEDLRGYDPLTPHRYTNLLLQAEGASPIHHHSLFTGVDDSLFDLFNVKYVLTERELNENWELIHDGAGGVNVYRNLTMLPRAFMVQRVQVVNDDAEALARVVDDSFDLAEMAVLEKRPSNWHNLPENSLATVNIVEYEPNYIHLKVEDNPQDGLLVLTDPYMPGWQAFVDGQETEIYATNYAFRGVVVPGGAADVEFVYSPKSFWLGLGISLVSLLILAILVIYWGLGRRKELSG